MTNAFKFIGGCTADVSIAVLDTTGLGKTQYYYYYKMNSGRPVSISSFT